MAGKLLLCDCLGTQIVDAVRLQDATGASCSGVCSSLCTTEIGVVAKALREGPVTVACGQETARFAELAEDLGTGQPGSVDIRDRAGWSDEGGDALPKMAALVAEAALPAPQPRSIDIASAGTCLVLGPAPVAASAAEALSAHLAVSLLLDTPDDAPDADAYDTLVGRIRRAGGSLGRFDLVLDGLRRRIPGGRGAPRFEPPRDAAQTECDIILDLSGRTPLFPAHGKRDGYLRADPGSQPAVAAAIMAASHLVGTFEKTLHVRMEPTLCAHSRAGQPACSNCLDICPTGAISPAGEHVSVDPAICAGCGACSAVCPSGAIAYDAPPVETVFRRLRTLAETYRGAGGVAPSLLVHDDAHGAEMIRLSARYGRGLPASVIPLEVAALSAFGHAEMLAALGVGFTEVNVLLSPETERDALEPQSALARALAGGAAVSLLEPGDPDALSDALYDTAPGAGGTASILPMGSRRQIARLAAKALNPDVGTIDLPAGAPYGAVLVDTGSCTLCLSCVSLCPSGALGDNPDKPQLLFQEDACLQCGLCANICPEDAITLKPRMDLGDAALTSRVLHEEEPFACIECGSLFGVRSTVERITEKLAGKHAMFATSEAARMIQMCDDCRVRAQMHGRGNPFAGPERPRVRTTDDYLSKRRDH
ncbi:4Fe-4S binding protein [Sulfitobacter sp. LCG007]